MNTIFGKPFSLQNSEIISDLYRFEFRHVCFGSTRLLINRFNGFNINEYRQVFNHREIIIRFSKE